MRRLLSLLLLLAACSTATNPPDPVGPSESTTSTTTTVVTPSTTSTLTSSTTSTTSTTTTIPPTTTTTTTTTTLPDGVTEPPEWLGTRPLEVDETGVAAAADTPPELSDRRFVTTDRLPPPDTPGFHATVGPVPPEVEQRSTWEEACPVALDELAYVTVTFVGFDGRDHTGELLVAADQAESIVSVFRVLYDEGFPIEQMAIASRADLDAPPTGDGNVTTAFVCRPVTGGSGWSEHAYGLAIDVNPFHNPYVRGERVLPELAVDYLDRDRRLPGTIHRGDAVTRAFADVGWEWGGNWSSLKDYQHFSLHDR